jgi:hypothetical protein
LYEIIYALVLHSSDSYRICPEREIGRGVKTKGVEIIAIERACWLLEPDA